MCLSQPHSKQHLSVNSRLALQLPTWHLHLCVLGNRKLTMCKTEHWGLLPSSQTSPVSVNGSTIYLLLRARIWRWSWILSFPYNPYPNPLPSPLFSIYTVYPKPESPHPLTLATLIAFSFVFLLPPLLSYVYYVTRGQSDLSKTNLKK